MSKSPQEIISDFSKEMVVKNPMADLSTGTLFRDLGVTAFSTEISAQYDGIDKARGLASGNVIYYTDLEADIFAAMYGIERLQPVKAVGEITFGASTVPLMGSPTIIPQGTIVKTTQSGATAPVSYVTTALAQITSSSPLDPNTGYYTVSVPIEAVVPGTSSNVPIGAINAADSTLPGVTAVFNRNSITNGTNTETTVALLARVSTKIRGRDVNTIPGLTALIETNAQVTDLVVVDPNHQYSFRGPGTVDVYVQGTVPEQYTQTVTEITQQVILDHPPVLEKSDISVVVAGISYSLADGYFSLVKDHETIYMFSTQARDKIVWTNEGMALLAGQTSYTITYSYNFLITALQNLVNDPATRPLTADILIRDTLEVLTSIQASIVVLPGFDTQATVDLVRLNIANFINVLKLGAPLRQSDIIGIIENTDGVDYVEIPMLSFNRKDRVITQPLVSQIIAAPLEYFRIQLQDLVIGVD